MTRPRPRILDIAPHEWVVARRQMPAWIHDEDPPYRPDVVMVIDPASGMIADVMVVHPRATADEVAPGVAEVIRAYPRPAPRVGVRIQDAALAEALERALGRGFVVVEDATPEAEAPLTSLAMSMTVAREDVPLDDAAPEVVGRFFAAAQRIFTRTPWRFATDGDILGLSAPAHGYPHGCLCIIGEMGQSLGVLLYESLDDYLKVLRGADTPPGQTIGPGVRMVSINYDDTADVEPARRRQAREHGWKAPRGGFPRLMLIEPDALLRPVRDREYELATAVLDALRHFLDEHRDAFGRPLDGTISSHVDTPAGRVTVSAPPEGATWRWGAESAYVAIERGPVKKAAGKGRRRKGSPRRK